MADAFYPFVGEGPTGINGETKPQVVGEQSAATEPRLGSVVTNPARIAVFDDASAAPRVVVVQPNDVRTYLEEITATVTRLAKEQGGSISFTVIREVVENFVHAYFIEPTISILNGGNTIRFSDQGPGIQEKDRALEYGTTSATEEMKQYIRGVGSGLPYAQAVHGGPRRHADNRGQPQRRHHRDHLDAISPGSSAAHANAAADGPGHAADARTGDHGDSRADAAGNGPGRAGASNAADGPDAAPAAVGRAAAWLRPAAHAAAECSKPLWLWHAPAERPSGAPGHGSPTSKCQTRATTSRDIPCSKHGPSRTGSNR